METTRTIPLSEIKGGKFVHMGREYTTLWGIEPGDRFVKVIDSSGYETTMGTHLHVEVCDDFNPRDVYEAFQYIRRFEKFARSRMMRLYGEYLAPEKDSFFNRAESVDAGIYEIRGNNEPDDLDIQFDFGFHQSGSFETEHISLDLITLPNTEWKNYMQERKDIKEGKIEKDRIAADALAKERRRAEYLKLKDEFGDE